MLFVPKKIRLHARRNLGIGNKVITPINKDLQNSEKLSTKVKFKDRFE